MKLPDYFEHLDRSAETHKVILDYERMLEKLEDLRPSNFAFHFSRKMRAFRTLESMIEAQAQLHCDLINEKAVK